MNQPNKIIRCILSSLLLATFTIVEAQDVNAYKPSNYAGPINYVRAWDVQAPITDPNAVTVTISQITELQTKYQSSLVVIGIPSEEAGFKEGDMDNLKKLFRDAAANFIIAEGAKVKKGAQQSVLFQGLTNEDQNRHFDQDVQGVGSKFFVDEGGDLYAVMASQLKLYRPLMDKILSREQAKK